MPDIDIQCQDCNNAFTFTESEQDFFREKGFSEPKRCKACRQARKQNGGDRGGSGERQGYRPQRSEGRRDDRPMFDAVCGSCGQNTQVPFKPSGDRPVYCRDCFRLKGAVRR